MSSVIKKAYETLECNYTCGLPLRKFLRVLSIIGMVSSIAYIAVGSLIIVHIVERREVELFPNAYRLPEGPTASRIVLPRPPYNFQSPQQIPPAEDFGIYRPQPQQHFQQRPFYDERNQFGSNNNPNPFQQQHSIFPSPDEKEDSNLKLEEERAIYYRANAGLFICLAGTLILINLIQFIVDICLFHSTFKGKNSISLWVFFLLNIILWIMTLICFITIFTDGGIPLLLVFLSVTSIRVYMVYILHELMSDMRKPRAFSGANVADIKPEPRTIFTAEEGKDEVDESAAEGDADNAGEDENVEIEESPSKSSKLDTAQSENEVDAENELNDELLTKSAEARYEASADGNCEDGEEQGLSNECVDGSTENEEGNDDDGSITELEEQIIVDEEIEQDEINCDEEIYAVESVEECNECPSESEEKPVEKVDLELDAEDCEDNEEKHDIDENSNDNENQAELEESKNKTDGNDENNGESRERNELDLDVQLDDSFYNNEAMNEGSDEKSNESKNEENSKSESDGDDKSKGNSDKSSMSAEDELGENETETNEEVEDVDEVELVQQTTGETTSEENIELKLATESSALNSDLDDDSNQQNKADAATQVEPIESSNEDVSSVEPGTGNLRNNEQENNEDDDETEAMQTNENENKAESESPHINSELSQENDEQESPLHEQNEEEIVNEIDLNSVKRKRKRSRRKRKPKLPELAGTEPSGE